MSFENQNEKIRWPEPGSVPENGAAVHYIAVEGSQARQPDIWAVMGVSREEGVDLVEIWHSYAADKFKKVKVPLEELRELNQ